MDQQAFIEGITAALHNEQRIRGLFLAGSFGRGTADRFSDVDLLAIVEPADHEALAAHWREILESIAPIVYFNRLPHVLVLNAITDQWLRCDLEIAARAALASRAQDRLKPLIDRDGLHHSLIPATRDPGPSPQRMSALIIEFIRVLGLTPVAIGREEFEVGVTGAGLLRGMLTNLLIAELGRADTGGILHLSRVLDAERLRVLASVPIAHPERNSVIEACLGCAVVFFPRARALATRLDIEWPEAFEAATRHALNRVLPLPYRADW